MAEECWLPRVPHSRRWWESTSTTITIEWEHELHGRGIQNFELIQSDGRTIPVEPNSIDFVYSLIVLQHVERFEVFCRYVQESERVLKPGGCAVLYFARKYRFSLNTSSKLLLQIDRIWERMSVRRGFLELPAHVNSTNLIVTLPKAIEVAGQYNLELMRCLVSNKGDGLFGGQNGIVVRKPWPAASQAA